MQDLQSSKLGSLSSNTDVSTSEQIITYSKSIISAEIVALGGNDKDHKNINERVKNYGVGIGWNVSADLGTAIGSDSEANSNALALGRYAKAAANGAAQLNGAAPTEIERYPTVNTEAYTLKFYAGSTNGNITIVDKDGKISADYATKVGTATVGSETNPIYLNNGVATQITSYTGNVTGNCSGSSGSCTGNASTATTLQTTHTIGGQSFNGSQDVVLSATLAEADAGTATDKLITPYATARAVKNALIHNANGTAGGTAIEGDATKAQVQSWLGTNQLTFVFNDSTTRTFNFVCNEVIS